MFHRIAATAVLTALLTTTTFAQNAGPVSPAMQPQMAQWLIVDQQNMIGLARYGEQIAVRPEVRQLAQTIRRDHEAMVQSLQNYAARLGNRNGTAEYRADVREDQRDVRAEVRDDRRDRREAINDARRDADGVRRPLENLADRLEDVGERIGEGARNVAEGTRDVVDAAEDRIDRELRGAPGDSTWLQLHREISDQIARDATAQLSRYSGREAEEAFLGTVLGAHLQGRATMKVFQTHADPQLAQILRTALDATHQHEMTAGRLMATTRR